MEEIKSLLLSAQSRVTTVREEVSDDVKQELDNVIASVDAALEDIDTALDVAAREKES